MALNASEGSPAQADDRKSLAIDFLAITAFILVIALVSQMLMIKWRPWFPGAESEKSLIGGVLAASRCLMPII